MKKDYFQKKLFGLEFLREKWVSWNWCPISHLSLLGYKEMDLSDKCLKIHRVLGKHHVLGKRFCTQHLRAKRLEEMIVSWIHKGGNFRQINTAMVLLLLHEF